MLTIKKEQQQAFAESNLKQFEEECLLHIRKFFPGHCTIIEEDYLRKTIRLGIVNSAKYNLKTKKNITLFLNCMLVMGSYFDEDPQYSWARIILTNNSDKNPDLKIELLAKETLKVFSDISGKKQIYLNRALLNFNENAIALYKEIVEVKFSTIYQFLNSIFPKKYEILGETNIKQLVSLSAKSSDSYNLTLDASKNVYTVLMYIMGSQFDKDPQFTWAGEILNDNTISDQVEKTRTLYFKAIGILESFLKQNNYLNN